MTAANGTDGYGNDPTDTDLRPDAKKIADDTIPSTL